MLQVGDKAPHIQLPNDQGENLLIPPKQASVLYFYPKDNTPGCTTQAKEFSQHKAEFEKIGVQILGVSPDSVQKHKNFITKQDLTIALMADENHLALNAYGVWVEKSMYGRTYMGVERSTFLIDEQGIIQEIWRKVRVKNHVLTVLEQAQKHFASS